MSNINQNVQQRITADKREIKDFPKFAYRQLLLSAKYYMKLPSIKKRACVMEDQQWIKS